MIFTNTASYCLDYRDILMLKASLYRSIRSVRLTAGVAIALLVLTAASVHAAGFYITEVGTPGSLGTAGTANPTNNQGADSAWTNPAGMTGIDRERVMAGGMTLILPKIEFDPSQNTTAPGSDGGNAGKVAGAAIALRKFV